MALLLEGASAEPKQIKMVLELSLEEQEQLEAEALAVLRPPAQEFGAL